MTATVRFTELVKAAGKPEVFVGLTDPRKDKAFTVAERQHRIVSLKQTPTGTRKDFGVVGVLREKFVTYLIFPKSLKEFADKRVVGIKYDVLDEPTKSASAPEKRSAKRKPVKKTKPQPPPPARKSFQVQVRLTAARTMEVEVQADSKKEARAIAKKSAQQQADFADAEIATRVLSIREAA